MLTRINISGSAVALSLACAPVFSQTEESKTAKPNIEHVLVTVPIHKTDAQTALPITAITNEQLRKLATTTIGDTLGNLPGLANASFGPSVGQPVIRGQQGPRVSVLLNGTSSADASTTSADHSISVEPILAESVEVLRGPSTLLYGGGAIGGVVNVIDNRIPQKLPEQFSGAAEIRHGTVNDEKTAVFKLEGALGNLAFHLDGLARETNLMEIPGLAALETHDEEEHEEEGHEEHEEESTNGFIGNSDSETESFTVGTSYVFDTGFVGIAVNKLNNNYGLPPGAHGHHEEEEHHETEEPHEGEEHDEGDIRIDIEQTRYDVRGAIFSDQQAIEVIRWGLTYNDYHHDEIEANGEIGTTFNNESKEARLELVHSEIMGFHGAIGLQVKSADFSAVDEESFIPQTDITRYGAFIIEDLHINDVIYELGLRLDRDQLEPDSITSETESFTSVSASGSALWQFDEQWTLGLAVSSSQRAPITEELFSNDGNILGEYVTHAATGLIELGSNKLDLEQANNIDATLSYKSDTIEGFVTLFYNDFNDYIYLANTGQVQDETSIFAFTQEDAVFTGIEFDVTLSLGSMLNGDVALRLFGDAVNGELDRSGDVPRMPPARLGSNVSYTRNALNMYLSVLSAADQNDTGLLETETDGYTRWDAGISYTFNEGAQHEYLTYIRFKNITDEEIRSSVSFLKNNAPEAGRSIEAGIRYTF